MKFQFEDEVSRFRLACFLLLLMIAPTTVEPARAHCPQVVWEDEFSGAPNRIAFDLVEPRFSDAGLQPATTYYYRVTAVDASGVESEPGPEASATTSSQTGRRLPDIIPGSDPPFRSIAATECVSDKVHVDSIVVSAPAVQAGGASLLAEIRRKDNCGNSAPHAGLQVNVSGRGPHVIWTSSDADGLAALSIQSVPQSEAEALTFCVDQVSHRELKYNSKSNRGTCELLRVRR